MRASFSRLIETDPQVLLDEEHQVREPDAGLKIRMQLPKLIGMIGSQQTIAARNSFPCDSSTSSILPWARSLRSFASRPSASMTSSGIRLRTRARASLTLKCVRLSSSGSRRRTLPRARR